MTSVKFKDDSYEQKEPLIYRTLLLTTFSTSMGVIDFYDQMRFLGDSWDILALNQVMRMKYVMIAYTRTQVFKQINYGTPVIRPLFFEDKAVDYSTIATQYMFGPSIIAQTDFTYSDKVFASNISWCSVHGGLSEEQICFEGSLYGNTSYD